MEDTEIKSQLIISLYYFPACFFCLYLEKYKWKIKEMQLNHWLSTLALLVQLIRNFLCVEPISITIGAAAVGASALCKTIFRFSIVFVLFVFIDLAIVFQKTLDTILCFRPACNFTENRLNHMYFPGLF